MTTQRLWVGLLLLGVSVVWAPAAHAQLEFETTRPRVFSIQERPYHLGHEFSLGLGVLPLDAFYVGAVLGGSYTYHFTDFWAWELINLNFSKNFDTALEGELLNDFNALPVQGGGDRITVFGTSNLIIKPLFGKLAIFNSDVVYSETFFALGGGLCAWGIPFVFRRRRHRFTLLVGRVVLGAGGYTRLLDLRPRGHRQCPISHVVWIVQLCSGTGHHERVRWENAGTYRCGYAGSSLS
ncbi:MAG: hypothetical protein R3C68_18035 [Myxococcota bacterium]